MANARQFMAARTAAWAKSGAPLPYDAEVEWIESSGTQYLKTGFLLGEYSAFNVKFIPLDLFKNEDSYFGYGDYKPRFYARHLNGRLNINTDNIGNNEILFTEIQNQVVDLSFSGDSISVNINGADRLNLMNGTQQSQYEMYICAKNNMNRPLAPSKMRLLSFAVTGLMDLIPVRFTNENDETEGAMYDRVSVQLFRNAGTGAFVIGPDKT